MYTVRTVMALGQYPKNDESGTSENWRGGGPNHTSIYGKLGMRMCWMLSYAVLTQHSSHY